VCVSEVTGTPSMVRLIPHLLNVGLGLNEDVANLRLT
jgi:hypothetical protein